MPGPTRRRRAKVAASSAAVAAAVLVGLMLALAPDGSPETTPSAPVTPALTSAPTATADPTTAPAIPEYAEGAALAAQLPLIEPDPDMPEYRSDTFGQRWADTDGNGCRQRDDVLARDMVDITFDDDGCTVLTGTLYDPYTATTITFQHDRVAEPGNPGSPGVQIDHKVSKEKAHAGGAWRWTPEQRLIFANDLDNLIAVDGPTNNSKSNRGPGQWWPPNEAYACFWALDYAEIVSSYELAVTASERDALVSKLTSCAE